MLIPLAATWTMYNNGGYPAFNSTPSYTANQSSFEIDTGTDFTPNLNFLIGLGAVDGNGRMKPAATVGILICGQNKAWMR